MSANSFGPRVERLEGVVSQRSPTDNNGVRGRDRTCDRLLKRLMHYQLSYAPHREGSTPES